MLILDRAWLQDRQRLAAALAADRRLAQDGTAIDSSSGGMSANRYRSKVTTSSSPMRTIAPPRNRGCPSRSRAIDWCSMHSGRSGQMMASRHLDEDRDHSGAREWPATRTLLLSAGSTAAVTVAGPDTWHESFSGTWRSVGNDVDVTSLRGEVAAQHDRETRFGDAMGMAFERVP
jgi:hypothetical protein